MRKHTLLSASVFLMSLLCSNPIDACARLHLQGVQHGAGREVTLRLSCLNKDSSLAPLPGASDYTLLVDGNPVSQGTGPVTSMEPIDLVAVVQVSPVMDSALSNIKPALHQVAKMLQEVPDSAIALVTYAAEVKEAGGLGRIEPFMQAVNEVAVVPDATEVRLIRAINVAYDLLKVRQRGRRKFLLVISDGIVPEMASVQTRRAFQAAGARLQAAGIVVSPVAYAPFDPAQLRYLQDLTRATGGHWRVATQAERIEAECKAVLEELKHQQLVMFSMPQGLTEDRAQFQAVYQRGERSTYSEPFDGEVPLEARKAQSEQKPEEQPEHEPAHWPEWVSLAGILISISLFGLTLLRRPARVPDALPSDSTVKGAIATHGKTTPIQQGARILVGWLVKIDDAAGKHEVIVVHDIVTLGHASQRFQVGKLSDGFELVFLDGGGVRRRIEDNQRFDVGSESYRFKTVQREE